MNSQRVLRLNVGRVPSLRPFVELEETPQRNPQRLAALLRRQAASVSDDVMTCPAVQLPSQLARLRDLRETLALVVSAEGLIPDAERERSDRQLLHPATVADWSSALEVLSRTHRAPAYVNTTQAELGQINRKLDTLAAMLCGRPGAIQAWQAVCESEVAG
jgi:hypothetical protein